MLPPPPLLVTNRHQLAPTPAISSCSFRPKGALPIQTSDTTWETFTQTESVKVLPSYPVYFAVVPSITPNDEQWRPCCYLPTVQVAIEIHDHFFQYRIRNCEDSTTRKILEGEFSKRKAILGMEYFQRSAARNTSAEPIWLILGFSGDTTENSLPLFCNAGDITRFLSVQDFDWTFKFQELFQASLQDPPLKWAMKEFLDYQKFCQWKERHRSMAAAAAASETPLPVPTGKPAAAPVTGNPIPRERSNLDHSSVDHQVEGDAGTVVTASSVSVPDTSCAVPLDQKETSPSQPAARVRPVFTKKTKGSTNRKRGRPPKKKGTSSGGSSKRSRTSKAYIPPQEKDQTSDTTPVTENPSSQRPLSEAQSAARPDQVQTGRRYIYEDDEGSPDLDRQAWVEGSNGIHDPASPVTRPSLRRGTTARRVFPTSGSTEQVLAPSPSAAEKESSVKAKGATPASATTTMDTGESAPATKDALAKRPEREPPLEAEPIPQVDLPGTTVREKLDSCLEALRKQNESVVGCRKILAPRKVVQDFFWAVAASKGRNGPEGTAPILHICGAPGSGKTMTVERCRQLVEDNFANESEEWEIPPKFCYVNCSHLQNRTKAEALQITLNYADTNEQNLKRPSDDCTMKPAVVFMLDEIDYLVSCGGSSRGQQRTKTETFVETLLGWASSPQYLVGVVGISNSVENEKAARLSSLGFPPTNKVVFRTYDAKDLAHIALSKIGNAVVEEKAIELLSKKVASSSGDARKFLEILSQSISNCLETISEKVLDEELEKPVLKVPHIMKAVQASVVKYKALVEDAPAHEKHVLCICIHLAKIIGSRPLPLRSLLSICREAYEIFEIDSISEVRLVLERLKDSGLLQVLQNSSNAWVVEAQQKIQFAVQLEDVEVAVEELVLKREFYRKMVERLQAMNVGERAL